MLFRGLQPYTKAKVKFRGSCFVQHYPPPKKRSLGFTLAELLISLAVLGVIATFTLPKILGGTGDKQNIAIAKEDYATVYGLMQDFTLSGQTDFKTYFFDYINAVKKCPNDGIAGGCRTVATTSNSPDASTWPTVLMPNGSTVHIIMYNSTDFALTIDANGDLSPNTGYSGSNQAEVFASWYGNNSNTDVDCQPWVGVPDIMVAHRLMNWCGYSPQLADIFKAP
jgi:prepilin-type N-terminal cleavage/methylation domain-containing protein